MAPASSGDPSRVLIVEDEEEIAELYATWLADRYAVQTVHTGEAALEALDPAIDIVLLDRRLPGLSGDDVLEWITEQDFRVEVAIVSAVTPDFGVLGLGIEEYLTKPIERADLVDVVDEMAARYTITAT